MEDWGFLDDVISLVLVTGLGVAYLSGCGIVARSSGKAIVSSTRFLAEGIYECATRGERRPVPKKCPMSDRRVAVVPKRDEAGEYEEKAFRDYLNSLDKSTFRSMPLQTPVISRSNYFPSFRRG